jgi:20S proteasome alpha/beta subunit
MLPKPPSLFHKLCERLPQRRRVTICLGIVASDGIIIAADREESYGDFKNDTGKILHTFRGREPIGWIATTGAGSGPELDEVSRLMNDKFCEERQRSDQEFVQAELTAEHRTYYKKAILPFALQPYMERPDYSLITGCFAGGLGKTLFVTSRIAFNKVSDYDAVGIGASVAKNWLSRLYDYIPAACAIKLAAYVIYQVKSSVSGCGMGTDITMMTGKELFGRVNPAIIRKWEEAFRYYPSLERGVFGYCIGVDPTETRLVRTHVDKESINANIEKLREMLTPSDVEKLEPGP